MRTKERIYPREILEQFVRNDAFNKELMRKAGGIQLLQSPDIFAVRNVRTDRHVNWNDGGKRPAGEYYETTVEVEKTQAQPELEIVKFFGQSPNLQKRNEVAAFVFPFTYHPRRTDQNRADILHIQREGLFYDDDIKRIFEEEDEMVKSLAEKPFSFQASIRHFNRDYEWSISSVGAWLRRPLMKEEIAYALAKIDTFSQAAIGTGRLREEVRGIVCGPNSDLSHPYFGLKGKLEMCYGK